jgi:imidazoleglycerol phosphate dehydratase HisB
MRTGRSERKTRETHVKIELDIDGSGKSEIRTPIKFLSHMLTSLSTHSLIDLKVESQGDLRHHIVEDTALVLGSALREALETEGRVHRFGYAMVPMDCSLASCAVDVGNRPYSVVEIETDVTVIEDMAAEDIKHFFESLAVSLRANIHVRVEYGENDHHKAEAAFKALALCLRQALSVDPRRTGVPSSKGVL